MDVPATMRTRRGHTDCRAQRSRRLWWWLNRCDVDMEPLGRGLNRDGHHYDRHGTGKGTLMRHFLRLA